MTTRYVALILLAGLVLLGAGCYEGCCPTPKEVEPCPEGALVPTPGPIIIITQDPGDPGKIQYTVDGTVQTDGGSGSNKLRDDFIGIKVLQFQCKRSDTDAWIDATHVQATKDGQVLNIKRTSSNGLDWYLESTSGGPATTLVSTETFTAGTVPSELLGYAFDTLEDTASGLGCSEMKIQVERAE